ncbi:MAG: hypothetical protein ABI746_07245 [Dermatophilaceae bacterium]
MPTRASEPPSETPPTSSPGPAAELLSAGVPMADLPPDFASALTVAIARSGLSLDALRSALLQRDRRLSVATLSYWRSARRRPERASSLAALTELEEILGLPPTALVGRLPRRDNEAPRDPASVLAMARSDVPVADDAERWGLSFDDGLRRISYHDTIEIDESGAHCHRRIRMLVRATRSGADRFPVGFVEEDNGEGEGDGSVCAVAAISGCHVGRRLGPVRNPAGQDLEGQSLERLTLTEMLLDTPLIVEEAAMVEYDVLPAGRGARSTRWERALLHDLPLYSLTVRFHPDRVPTSMERYERPVGTERERVAPVLVTSPTVTVLYTDLTPGVAGLAWRW